MPQSTFAPSDVAERSTNKAIENSARENLLREFSNQRPDDRNQIMGGRPEAALNGDQATAKITRMQESQKAMEGFGFGTCTIIDSGAKVCRVEEGKVGSSRAMQKPERNSDNTQQEPPKEPGEKPELKPWGKKPEVSNTVPNYKPEQDKPIKDPGFLRPLIPGNGKVVCADKD